MKIKKITLSNFKRFSHLTIKEIPQTTKLIILLGPNGSGKTSIFEAFNHWYKFNAFGSLSEKDYIIKKAEIEFSVNDWFRESVSLEFFDHTHSTQDNTKGKFYFRSA